MITTSLFARSCALRAGRWRHAKRKQFVGETLHAPSPARAGRRREAGGLSRVLRQAASSTPRVTRSVATPVGSSNIDFIMQQGTLVIGWVGPALFAILFAAFAWATGVFQWLWSLATWLFSGAWRGGGEV